MKKGTCQVCFAAHPINKDGRVRKHLRERGDSIAGDCAGYAFKPFEVDCAGLQWVFDSYVHQLTKTREKLLAVHVTPEVCEPGWYVPKPEENRSEIVRCLNVITPGEPGYEKLVDQLRNCLNRDILKYKESLEAMDRVIKRYEPIKNLLSFATILHDFPIYAPDAAE